MNATSVPPPDLHLVPLPSLVPPIPNWALVLAGPIVTYWTFSLFFHVIDSYNLLQQYRLHTPAELLLRNHVSLNDVLRDVLLQHIIQSVLGFCMSYFDGEEFTGMEGYEIQQMLGKLVKAESWVLSATAITGVDSWALEKNVVNFASGSIFESGARALWGALGLSTTAEWRAMVAEFVYWYTIPAVRIGAAIFVLDTWQYWLHRLMHESKFLYRHFHSRHHRLYVPFAFGALYNHPFEGLLLDSFGALLAHTVTGLSTRSGLIFFCGSMMKTVDDHCGYKLPFDPLQRLFANNAGYHDVHHQSWGIKTNYSQPFLICWDRWLGTQWKGGDVSARYEASRLKAAEKAQHLSSPLKPIVEQEDDLTNSPAKANGHANGHAANGHANGNGVRPRVPNGKAAAQAREGREQAGERVVREESREERRAEEEVERLLRRSPRKKRLVNNGVAV